MNPASTSRAADEGIERELHCGVFAHACGCRVGRTPDRDEEILWDDGDFVEDEKQQQIEAEEDAVDAADQREIEREKFPGAVLDVPGEKDAGDGDDPVSSTRTRLMPSAAR